MKIDIRKTLDFFDVAENSRGHASSVVGIIGEDLNAATFRDYMIKQKNAKEVIVVPDETPRYGVPGGAGKWLDRWIYVKEKKGKEILYQCEIKNWSATSVGGFRSLDAGADNNEVCKATKHNWNRQKRFFSGELKPDNVTKVLLPMKILDEFKDNKKIEIRPLLIHWMPVSNTDKIDPEFIVSVSDLEIQFKAKFTKLYIFSVSLYLRQLYKPYKRGQGRKFIELDMPHFERRMKILTHFKFKK